MSALTRLTIRLPAGIEVRIERVEGGEGEPTPHPEICEPVVREAIDLGAGQTLQYFNALMLMAGDRGNYRWNAAGCRGAGGPNAFCRGNPP